MPGHRAKLAQNWFLYLLECANGAVYTGIALDVKARLAQHKCGKGAKYTRANPPKKLLATKKFRTKSAALKEEWRVKRLTAAQKRVLAKAMRTLKLMPILILLPLPVEAAPQCTVRVMPGFAMPYVYALNARGFKVVVDPEVKSDDFPGFLSRYVKRGEYGILVGGIFRGGFELWARDGERPMLSRWEWFQPSERVIREQLPLCPDFLKEYRLLPPVTL